MQKCDEGCVAVCDNCIEYAFNPGSSGEYLGKGFCNLLFVKKDPTDTCEYFKCFNTSKEKIYARSSYNGN